MAYWTLINPTTFNEQAKALVWEINSSLSCFESERDGKEQAESPE